MAKPIEVHLKGVKEPVLMHPADARVAVAEGRGSVGKGGVKVVTKADRLAAAAAKAAEAAKAAGEDEGAGDGADKTEE